MEVKINALFYKDIVADGRCEDLNLLIGRRTFAKFGGTDKIVEITPAVYNNSLNDLFCIIDESEERLLEHYKHCITVMILPERIAKIFFKDGVLNAFINPQTKEHNISSPPAEKEFNKEVIDSVKIKIYPSGKKRRD